MAKGLGTLTVWLSADTRNFAKGMTSAKRTMAKFSNAITIGVAAGSAAILAFGIKSVKAFAMAEESTNKFAIVFKSVATSANASARDLADSFGLAQSTAKRMLGDTGDLLTGFGYSADEALRMSTATNKLGIDLASFTNYAGGAEGATQALVKAFTGEREAVKALGIVIREEMVMDKLRLAGKDKLTGFSLIQAKAEATLAIAIEQSKNAIGDYDRTSGSLVNTQRRLGESYKSISESFGAIIVEAFGVTEGLGFIEAKFTELSKYMQDNLHEIIYIVQSMVVEISSALNQTWTFLSNYGNGIVSIFTTVAQNIFNIGEWVFDNIVKYFTNLPSIVIGITTDIYNLIKNVLTTYLELFYNFGEAVWSVLTGGGISGALDDMLKNASQNMVNAIADIGKETGKAMVKAGFTELKIEEPDYAGIFRRIFDDIGDIEAAKTAKLEELLAERVKKAGAIAGVADAVKAEEGKASAAKAEKATSPLVSAIQKGSMEAMRAEQGRTKTEDKIEANTRKTASGIDKMAEGMSKILGKVGIAGGLNLEAAI